MVIEVISNNGYELMVKGIVNNANGEIVGPQYLFYENVKQGKARIVKRKFYKHIF